MNGEHLDVLVTVATIAVFVLDPEIGKMNPVIEVRQVMSVAQRRISSWSRSG